MEDSLLNVSSKIQQKLLKSFLESKTPDETPKVLRSNAALINNNIEDVRQNEKSTSFHILYDNITSDDESGIINVDDQTYANITQLDDSEDLSASHRVPSKHNLRHIIRNTKSRREKPTNYTVFLTPLAENKDTTSAAVDLENLEAEKDKIIQLRKGKNKTKKARVEVESLSRDEVQVNSNSLLSATSGEDEMEEAKDKINKLRKVKRKATLPKIDKIINKDGVHTSGDVNHLNFSFSDSSDVEDLLHAKKKPSTFKVTSSGPSDEEDLLHVKKKPSTFEVTFSGSSDEEDLLHAKKKPSTFKVNDISFTKNLPDTVPSLNSSPTAVLLEQLVDQSVNQVKKRKRKRKSLNFKKKKTRHLNDENGSPLPLVNRRKNILSDVAVSLNETYANSSVESHNLTSFETKKIALKRKAVKLSFDSIIHQVSEAEKQKEIQLKNIASKNQSPPTAKGHHANSDLSNNTSPIRNLKKSFDKIIDFTPRNNNSVMSKHLNISQSVNLSKASNMLENEGVADFISSQQTENLNYPERITSQNSENSPSKSLRNMSKTFNISHSTHVDKTSSVLANKIDDYQSSSLKVEKLKNPVNFASKSKEDSTSKNLRNVSKSLNISHSAHVDKTSSVLENDSDSYQSSSLHVEKLTNPVNFASKSKEVSPSKNLRSLSKSLNISHSAHVDKTSSVLEDDSDSYQSSSLQVEKLTNPVNFASKSKEVSPTKNLRSLSKSLNISHSAHVDKTSSVLEDDSDSYQSSSLQVEKLTNPVNFASKSKEDSPSKNLRSLSKSLNISHSAHVDKTSSVLEDDSDSYQSSSLQVEKLTNPVNFASKSKEDSPSKNLRSLSKSLNISHSAHVDKTSSVLEDDSDSYQSSSLQVEKLTNPVNFASKSKEDSPSKNLRSLSKSLNISHSAHVNKTSSVLENDSDSYQSSPLQVEKLTNPVNFASKSKEDSPSKNLRSLSKSLNISHSAHVDKTSSVLENDSDSYQSSPLQVEKLTNPVNFASKSVVDSPNKSLRSVQNSTSVNELQANVVVSEDSMSENRKTLKSDRSKSNLNFGLRSEYSQEKNLNNQANLKQPTLKEFLAKLSEGSLPTTSSKEKPLTNFLNSYVPQEKEIPKKKNLKRKPRDKEIEHITLSVNYNKKLFEHFSHHKVTKEAMTAVQQATEIFFSQFYNDVSIILNLDNLRKKKEGRGNTVHKEHIYTMMKQLELVNSLPQLHAMMQEMLPASEWQKVIPIMLPFDNVYPKTDCAGKKH